jgi:hypothetical protein
MALPRINLCNLLCLLHVVEQKIWRVLDVVVLESVAN